MIDASARAGVSYGCLRAELEFLRWRWMVHRRRRRRRKLYWYRIHILCQMSLMDGCQGWGGEQRQPGQEREGDGERDLLQTKQCLPDSASGASISVWRKPGCSESLGFYNKTMETRPTNHSLHWARTNRFLTTVWEEASAAAFTHLTSADAELETILQDNRCSCNTLYCCLAQIFIIP